LFKHHFTSFLLRITGDAGSDTRKYSRESLTKEKTLRELREERKITGITISTDYALHVPARPHVAEKFWFVRMK
jgi:hypothetical protein